ncbi:MAG: hypothetical protein NW223_15870 [Hyphomicrobiaceae bacterium]|nr:hypothetical protein [Hyphomicrobiaceae bacterium]
MCAAVHPVRAFIIAAIFTALACWIRFEDLRLSFRAMVERANGADNYMSTVEIMAYYLPNSTLVVLGILAAIAIGSGAYNSLVKRHPSIRSIMLAAIGIPGVLISAMVVVLKLFTDGG